MWYKKFKNFILASSVATFFHLAIIDGISVTTHVIAVLSVCCAVYILLNNADKHFERETLLEYMKRRQKHESHRRRQS